MFLKIINSNNYFQNLHKKHIALINSLVNVSLCILLLINIDIFVTLFQVLPLALGVGIVLTSIIIYKFYSSKQTTEKGNFSFFFLETFAQK